MICAEILIYNLACHRYGVASSGAQLTCTISNATATDTSTFNGSPSTTGTDTVTYAWTASAGTLGSATSASTSWTAPTTPQTSAVTLTCKISATAPAVTSPDGGTRGPSSKSATVQIYIPVLTVTGGSSWSPDPANVGDVIQCSATGTVSPSVPGATDNVNWTSGGTYTSADGSDPMSIYNGSEVYVYTQGSLTSQFTATFFDPGYYMIGVTAVDTLTDSNGHTLGSITGIGYVGGSAADLSGGSGPQAAVVAHTVGAPASPAKHVTVNKGTLTYAGLDITTSHSGHSTPVVEAGQQITVTATISPTPSSYTWTIGGTTVGGFTIAADGSSGQKVPLVKSGANLSSITFYWTGAGSPKVQCNTVSGTFSVKCPVPSVSTHTSYVVIAPTKNIVSFGQVGLDGIDFNGLADTSGYNFSGTYEWFQIITQPSKDTVTDSTGHGYINTFSNGLDTYNPYDRGLNTADNPDSATLRGSFETYDATRNYQMYLMYLPGGSGSIPVPMGSVTWTWSAKASLVDQGSDTWALTSSSNSQNPAFSPSSDYPVWTTLSVHGSSTF